MSPAVPGEEATVKAAMTRRSVLRVSGVAVGLAAAHSLGVRPPSAHAASAWTNPMLGTVDGAGQRYGDSRSGGRVHVGYDIGTARVRGRPVVAGCAGTVVETDHQTTTARGKLVMIQHDGGVRTLYQHLEEIGVQQGQRVLTGQEIGICGGTGGSSGQDYAIHLHLEVYVGGIGTSKRPADTTDPRPFFLERGVLLGRSTPVLAPSVPDSPPVPERRRDLELRLIRNRDNGDIWLVGAHNMEKVPSMESYYALEQVWGSYTDMSGVDVERVRDATFGNIIALATSLKGQGL